MFWRQTALPIAAAFSSVLVTACSFNPVTGENQLSLMRKTTNLIWLGSNIHRRNKAKVVNSAA